MVTRRYLRCFLSVQQIIVELPTEKKKQKYLVCYNVKKC